MKCPRLSLVETPKPSGGPPSSAVVLGLLLLSISACDESEKRPPDDPGTKAMDYVRAEPFSKIHIEVDAIDGVVPNQTSLRWSRVALTELLGKKEESTLVIDDRIPPGPDEDPAYDLDAVRALEAQYRQSQTGGDTAAIYVIVLDGHHHEDTDTEFTLGLAYSSSAVVIFLKTIRRLCTAGVRQTDDELLQQALCPIAIATTLTHELGHIIGLVNNGLPMVNDHHDAIHGAHDTNTECIMFWQNNSYEIFDRLIDRILNGTTMISPFGDRCLEDIEAARE